MDSNPKDIVRTGYDACAARYNATRVLESWPELGMLLDGLPPNAAVLDIGCGNGRLTSAFTNCASITGVDISPTQIAAAQKIVPNARLIAADIMTQEFGAGAFDAIVSFYTLIHLPRAEHKPLLTQIARWLKPTGHVLISVGRTDTPVWTEADFFGAPMYWSHYDAEWYEEALQSLGFDIISRGVVGLPAEHHPLLLARAPTAPRASAV